MKIKIILAVVLISVFCVVIPAHAITDEERNVLIQQLLQQIATLQAQINQIIASQNQNSPVVAPNGWCHTFVQNLSLGNSGSEVNALNSALSYQGYSTASSGTYFSQTTKQALAAFQDRYASEILYPLGLTRGTGVLGASTRRKLNQIYQCAPLVLMYPSGGETLQVGDVVRITWKASGLATNETLTITTYMPSNPYLNVKTISASVLASQGYYDWTVSTATLPSTSYPITLKIKITSRLNKDTSVSSNDFTVNSDANSQLSNISLVYPQGGQTLYIGDSARITWTSKGLSASDRVSISVFASDSPYSNVKVITSNVLASQEYYDWTIANTNMPSTSYPVKIRVRIDVVNKNISAQSSSDITVNAQGGGSGLANISVVYPVGGEVFEYDESTARGDTPRITWSTTGFTSTDRLIITVRPVATPYLNVKTITSSILATQGYYDWRLTTATMPELVSGDQLVFIEIRSDSRNISAKTNAFTIRFIPRAQ